MSECFITGKTGTFDSVLSSMNFNIVGDGRVRILRDSTSKIDYSDALSPPDFIVFQSLTSTGSSAREIVLLFNLHQLSSAYYWRLASTSGGVFNPLTDDGPISAFSYKEGEYISFKPSYYGSNNTYHWGYYNFLAAK